MTLRRWMPATLSAGRWPMFQAGFDGNILPGLRPLAPAMPGQPLFDQEVGALAARP